MMRSPNLSFALVPLSASMDMRSRSYGVDFCSASFIVPLPCIPVPSQAPFMMVNMIFRFWFSLSINYPTDSSNSTTLGAEPFLGGSSCMVKMRPRLPLYGTSFIFNKTDCPGK